MPRLIDADALKADIKEKRDHLDSSNVVGRGEYIALNKALTMIDEQPTVDAVEVVRCGQCKYFRTAKCTSREDGWYCADGERKEKEND